MPGQPVLGVLSPLNWPKKNGFEAARKTVRSCAGSRLLGLLQPPDRRFWAWGAVDDPRSRSGSTASRSSTSSTSMGCLAPPRSRRWTWRCKWPQVRATHHGAESRRDVVSRPFPRIRAMSASSSQIVKPHDVARPLLPPKPVVILPTGRCHLWSGVETPPAESLHDIPRPNKALEVLQHALAFLSGEGQKEQYVPEPYKM